MLGALDFFKQRTDVVVGAARKRGSHAHRLHVKGLHGSGCSTLRQARAQVFVDHHFEGSARFTRFGLQSRGDIIIECQRRSHSITMLA